MTRSLKNRSQHFASAPGGTQSLQWCIKYLPSTIYLSPQKYQAAIGDALIDVWDDIPESLFESLWQSMPDRVATIIDAKGWHTRY